MHVVRLLLQSAQEEMLHVAVVRSAGYPMTPRHETCTFLPEHGVGKPPYKGQRGGDPILGHLLFLLMGVVHLVARNDWDN